MFELNPTPSVLMVEIRREMVRKNYTLKRLAAEIDLPVATLASHLNTGTMRVSEMIDICNVLGIDLMWRSR